MADLMQTTSIVEERKRMAVRVFSRRTLDEMKGKPDFQQEAILYSRVLEFLKAHTDHLEQIAIYFENECKEILNYSLAPRPLAVLKNYDPEV